MSAPYVVTASPRVLRFASGATAVNEEIQAAVDAATPNQTIQLASEGTFYIDFPLRLRNEVVLSGASRLTALASNLGGPMIIVGADRPLPTHATAILDDADYSYVFGVGTPKHYINTTLYGFRAGTRSALWIEIPFAMTVAPSDTAHRMVEMGGQIWEATGYTYSLRIAPNGDLQRLNVSIKIGGVIHVLTTTSTFHTGLGTRHMLAISYDGSTVRLFVDGTIEDSEAATGTFEPPIWESLIIGGAIFRQFPVGELLSNSMAFNLGGFLIKSTARYTANYVVSWTKPTPTEQDICSIWCEDDRERDSLIKLGLGGNDYGWLQSDNNAVVTSSLDVRVMDFTLGHSGGIAAQSTGIHVLSTTRTHLRRLDFTTGCATVGIANSYYSILEEFNHTGNGRVGIHWAGGMCEMRGLFRTNGAEVGVALNYGGTINRIHVYDYGVIGVLIDQCSGVFDVIGVSDEGGISGADQLYGIYIKKNTADPANLQLLNAGVDVSTSDVTIPFGVEGYLQQINVFVGQSITPGLTTPPAEFVHFPDPANTDPIFFDYRGIGIPLSLNRELILTPDGPLGAKTLTDADTTVSVRDGREFDYLGVTLTANRVLTLDDADDPGDGVCVRVRGNPTFGGYTLTVKNHDATTLHVFSVAGTTVLRFSAVTGDWSEV